MLSGIDAMVEVPADNVPLFVNDNRFYVYEAVGPMFVCHTQCVSATV